MYQWYREIKLELKNLQIEEKTFKVSHLLEDLILNEDFRNKFCKI